MPALYTRIKTWAAGNVLTAADLNAEFDNNITNGDATKFGGFSTSTAQARQQTDPGTYASPSLATSISDEIQRLRFAIGRIIGGANSSWLDVPANGLITGPGSSTDNALVRFDGTTGKTIQNSGVILDDSNNLSGVVGITATGAVTTSGNISTTGSGTITAAGTITTTANISTSSTGNIITTGSGNIATTGSGDVKTTGSGNMSSAGTLTVAGNTTLATLFGTLIQSMGANTAGWVHNLGMSYSAGTWTLKTAAGGSLGSTDAGFVTMPSTTGGRLVSLKVNFSVSFNDDAHASSDLTNQGWAITEANDWAQDMPFFIYAANKADSALNGIDGNSAFFITRHPALRKTPSSANYIGDTDGIPANDDLETIILLGSYTEANYTNLICEPIGCFRMRWSGSTADWTVQALGDTDGMGQAALSRTYNTPFTMPQAQQGASASTHMLPNGGTAPVFTTANYVFQIDRSGKVLINISFSGDGGADGAGAVNAQVSLPYSRNNTDFGVQFPGSVYVENQLAAATNGAVYLADLSSNSSLFELKEALNTAATAAKNADFSSGNRVVQTTFTYRLRDKA